MNPGERMTGIERPRFANFSKCAKPSCDGLCYDHHPFSDAFPVSEKEISSCICIGMCAQEYCHVESCSCFWKLQKEIVNLRERLAKTSERHMKKCENYKAEIATLRASVKTDKPSFAEDVLQSFGHHFHSLNSWSKKMENAIRNDFCMTLRRLEQNIEERDSRISQLSNDNISIECKVVKLEAEVTRLQRLVTLQVHQTRGRASPYN